MGLLATIAGPLAERFSETSTALLVAGGLAAVLVLTVVLNVLKQILVRNPNEPPLVFHWLPMIGSTITYGIDPYKFFFSCREKYGDVFTFVLLGKKTTVCLGTKGNEFVLNGKLSDVNAEEIYGVLTTPVFGKDVVYDCPNAKLMEQKKFVKFGLTTQAFETYVALIVQETLDFLQGSWFPSSQDSGVLDVPPAMSELVLYTASLCLQGKEVREKFNSSFADLYHDLDMGFAPINFMLPWFPLPHNRRRDAANKKMAQTYLDIMEVRKAGGNKKNSEDMIWNLMNSVYKDGTPIPDHEVAHMMIALLLAGQHSSASTASWILLRLAQNPHITEELLAEQRRVLGDGELTYDNVQKLPLNAACVKETLRIHSPIHSIMRKVTNTLTITDSRTERTYTIPTSHTLLAAPGVTSKTSEYFPNPDTWDPHRWDAPTTTDPNSVSTSTLPTNAPASKPSTNSASPATTNPNEELTDYGYGLVTKGANSPYLPFGAGRHRCIGEQFAYLQLGTVMATLVRHLRFRSESDGVVGERVVETDYSSLFSAPLRPARVRWERRRRGEKVG